MQLTFLGTGSMVPIPGRSHNAILLSHRQENILIDCGEGTQTQLRKAKISPAKITKLLITHWHGDHVLGLPGLIQTLGTSEYKGVLDIYGPKGSKQYFIYMFRGFINQSRVQVRVHEIQSGLFFEDKQFTLSCFPLYHPAPCLGYTFQEKDRRRINMEYMKTFKLTKHPILKKLQQGQSIEWKGQTIDVESATTVVKGKKLTFILDTKFFPALVEHARAADVLVCEATHMEDLREKTEKYKHMTSKQAAELGKRASVGKLYLTHFSQRYTDLGPLLKEARSVFPKAELAQDLLSLAL